MEENKSRGGSCWSTGQEAYRCVVVGSSVSSAVAASGCDMAPDLADQPPGAPTFHLTPVFEIQ